MKIIIPNQIGGHEIIYNFCDPEASEKINLYDITTRFTLKTKLNIFIDKDRLSIKSSLSEQGLDIFNINGQFFTDICKHYCIPKNFDISISLKNRIKKYYQNIMTVCR